MAPLPEPFATPEELRARPGCGEIDDDTAGPLLGAASAQVRAIVGQTISPIDDDTVLLDGDGTAVLELPEVPVRDISVVTIGERTLEPDVDYRWSRLGWIRRIGSRRRDGRVGGDEPRYNEWPYGPDLWRRHDLPPWGRWPAEEASIGVVYSHGWPLDSTQYDIAKQVTLRLASAMVLQPTDVVQESIGDYSVTYRSTPEITGVEVQLLAGLRR